MNKKLFVSVVLAVTFIMLASPVFADSMTRHTLYQEAVAMYLYDSDNDRTMFIGCTEGYLFAEAGKMKEEWKRIMKVTIYNSDGTVYWTNEPAGQTLAKGEFKWSSEHVTLSTTVNFFGNIVPLAARWDAINPPEPIHENKWVNPDWHMVINSFSRDAMATVKLDDMTFNYDSTYVDMVLIIHHMMMDLYK